MTKRNRQETTILVARAGVSFAHSEIYFVAVSSNMCNWTLHSNTICHFPVFCATPDDVTKSKGSMGQTLFRMFCFPGLEDGGVVQARLSFYNWTDSLSGTPISLLHSERYSCRQRQPSSACHESEIHDFHHLQDCARWYSMVLLWSRCPPRSPTYGVS